MTEFLKVLGGLTTVYVVDKFGKEEKKVESGEIKIYKEERNPIGFSKSIKDAVKMVTFSEKTNPVGSYKYRVHAYPSDIDIFEKIEECCDVKTATQNVTKRLKQIARNIKNNKKVYLGDFKAGIDDDLIIDCGEISYTKPISVSGYKRQTIMDKLTEFKKKGWITETESRKLKGMAKPNLNVVEFSKLYKELRELYLVRWELNELIKGEKVVRSGKKLKLQDALTHDSIVKIDIWAPVNNRYTEVTNFFYIVLKQKNGKETVINKKLGDYASALMDDINKYSSTIFRNSLKVGKRLWIYHNLKKNKHILEKLYPLFFSGSAALNQIKEEAVVLVDMLQRMEDNSQSDINKGYGLIKPIVENQIDEFKKRVNNIYDLRFNREEIFKTLDKCIQSKNTSVTKKNLEKFIELCKPIIEKHSVKFLKDIGLVTYQNRKHGEEGHHDALENYKLLL